MITPDGKLLLKGHVYERQTSLDTAGIKAFIVRDNTGKAVSMIDSDGNLKMLKGEATAEPTILGGNGYLLVRGIPYTLKNYQANDLFVQ